MKIAIVLSGAENYGFHSLPLKANLLSNLHSAKDGSWCLKGGGRMSLMTQDAVLPWGFLIKSSLKGVLWTRHF